MPAAHDSSGRTPVPGLEDAARIEAAAGALAAPVVLVSDSLAQAAQAAATETARLLAGAVVGNGVAHLALTGGSGGAALADQLVPVLADQSAGTRQAVHLWFGDERFVPASGAERNDLLAEPLAQAGIPQANVHRLPGPDAVSDLDAAAAALAADLAAHGLDRGRFDVIHLGVGPDAHVCSLFPAHPAALATGRAVVPVRQSPKPPAQRVSLTFDVLQRARRLMVVAGGRDKAQAVSRGLGPTDVVGAPASCARGVETTWYLDTAAAAGAPAGVAVG